MRIGRWWGTLIWGHTDHQCTDDQCTCPLRGKPRRREMLITGISVFTCDQL
ncbi:unnamed protein product [Staurois parvus]|uniref:Uncharacterized protein n=1 Tax=Staurois parvus TaxID=386267 RepID=A0ABN9CQ24_9NEOB|nr:unnamed protein product [Staurois parvus]